MLNLSRAEAHQRREALGVSPTSVSRHLGLPHDAVRDWERHGTSLPGEALPRLAALLDHLEVAAAQGDVLVLDPALRPADADPVLERLIALRLELGVSQLELAAHLGVNQYTVSNWERGFRAFHGQRWQAQIVAALQAAAAENQQKWNLRRGEWQRQLAQRRRETGLSQKRMARALCVPPSTLSHWETGRSPVPERYIRSFEEVFKHALPDRRLPRECGTPKATESWQAGLRQRRLEAGLTLRQVALAIHLTVQTVATWEAGKRPIPVAHAQRLERALERLVAERQVRIHELVHEPEAVTPSMQVQA
jgi:transcriptional regulator with XRE-family HTH domain